MPVTLAELTDVPELAALVNAAFRGGQGWTSETGLIAGQRIDEAGLTELMCAPEAVILKNTADDHLKITGCVYLQKRAGALYLGMLTVSPLLQAKGLGRQLLQAAEGHALATGCNTVMMTVITVRTQLIAWYERRGYQKTGEVIPLIIPASFGVLKQPLEMYKLEKCL